MPTEQSGEDPFSTGTIGLGEAANGGVIGLYTLLQLIGQGGMGEVWLAEQKHPVRRRVALKLIKVGMDTREAVARFESERQALALMDHPAIAKVFDAGSTPQGRPYFVMEYVAGIPITEYCDKHKLNVRQRLELFVHVCEGVQHAHQKAILHRDLKPSNILVGEVDGKPAPRIIDFGVAKATAQGLTAGTVFTRVGAMVGTPGYMSPEQADWAGADVDTRTDVYSLGVVLYELLVDALPLDFSNTPVDQFLRKLREEDAARPSTRVRAAGDQSTLTAQKRGTDRPTLVRQLRGDLDAICLKALEKDRARRYPTPLELAADTERYLRNEPVLARPASSFYRARKYVRRHRVGVVVAGLLVVLLISATVAQTFELRRTRRERDRAARVTAFMTDMFKVSDPSEARGNSITAREILDKASKEIGTGLAKDTEVQAEMMHLMGNVYVSLGLYPKGEALLRNALAIRRRTLGQSNQDTLYAMHRLASVLNDESQYAEAEKLSRETLELRRGKLGEENRETLRTASLLAQILNGEGHYPEAEKLSREVIDTGTRVLGRTDPSTRLAMKRLAITYAYQGKFPEAEKMFREVLENDQSTYGPDHPDVLGDLQNLAAVLLHEHRYAEAEKLNIDVLQRERQILGPEHPDTLMTMGNLALVLSDEKRYAEAEKLFRDTLEIKRKQLGPEHRSTLVTMGNLADVLVSEGKYAEAGLLVRQTLETERRVLGPEHSDYLAALDSYGALLKKEKRHSEAEKVSRETLEARRRVLGLKHPDTAVSVYNLACVLALEGKREEALTNLQYAVDYGLSADIRQGIEADDDLKSLKADPRFATLAHSAAR